MSRASSWWEAFAGGRDTYSKVIGQALAKQEIAPTLRRLPRYWEAGALALALAAVALGLVPMQPSGFLQIGRPGLSAVKP